ncbi:hypothetical protein [Stenotrophomonas sp. SrG]|uniref:hypothetical protein n=1 Tax=Stenotrophomonas sp. SrG TaxID=3414430 RepID=UPI003CF50903
MDFQQWMISADWDDIREWLSIFIAAFAAVAATVVGVAAAIGTILVAVLANRTSMRATQIAEEAKGIAKMQHEAGEALRKANAKILGRLLLLEVSTLPTILAALTRGWTQAITMEDGSIGLADPQAFVQILVEAKLPLTPMARSAEDRIHNLPDDLGAELASLIAACIALNDIAGRLHTKVRVDGKDGSVGYAGNQIEMIQFRQQFKAVLARSVRFARELQVFVGIEADRYSEIDDVLQAS